MTPQDQPSPNTQSVQQRTTAYAKRQGDQVHDHSNEKPHNAAPLHFERDVIISFRISRFLANRIESYRSKYRKKTKTESLTDLLEIALYVVENAERLDDPAIVKYFQENLYNVQLVDDVTQWPQDRVEAILGVLVSERERRFRLKLGQNHHV